MEALEEINEKSLYSDLEKMVMKEMVEEGFNPWNQKDIKEFWEKKIG